MGKKRTKEKKQSNPLEIIWTDVWEMVATSEQKQQMIAPVEEYCNFLSPSVLIVNAQWINLADLTAKDKVNALERMLHKTVDNPYPKHSYFQKIIHKYPSFRKFPSYLKRAAIAEAMGIVSSFQSRYRSWQSGDRTHRQGLPPRLTAMCQAYPVLYKGQQIKYGLNYSTVALKVWNGTDWVWIEGIKIKRHC
jgi:putative transposase